MIGKIAIIADRSEKYFLFAAAEFVVVGLVVHIDRLVAPGKRSIGAQTGVMEE
jgi:hypothetical protein